VLNKNVRSYGKMHMFDNCSETCWNSDAGMPQWVLISFEEECNISSFEVEFQGGFAGKNCHIEAGNDRTQLTIIESFYPKDKNNLQRFILKNQIKAKIFKFVFKESTDFFGRIIIYNFSLYSWYLFWYPNYNFVHTIFKYNFCKKLSDLIFKLQFVIFISFLSNNK